MFQALSLPVELCFQSQKRPENCTLQETLATRMLYQPPFSSPRSTQALCSADMLVAPKEFSKLFWTSDPHGLKMAADLETGVFDKSKAGASDRALVHTAHARGFFPTLKLASMRQLKLDLRDKALTRGRTLQVRASTFSCHPLSAPGDSSLGTFTYCPYTTLSPQSLPCAWIVRLVSVVSVAFFSYCAENLQPSVRSIIFATGQRHAHSRRRAAA